MQTYLVKWSRVFLGLCLTLSFARPLPATAADADDATVLHNIEERRQQMAERLERATVWVIRIDEDGDYAGHGSGFVVAPGVIMTNAHVVDEIERFVLVNDYLSPVMGKAIALAGDEGNDFALVAFEDPATTDLPILTFNTEIKRMDRVSAWGYPGMVVEQDVNFEAFAKGDGMRPPPLVFTEGTVNAIVQRPWKGIIHSASIAQGNSGGPLVNSRGEVVGVNTWGLTEFEEQPGIVLNGSLAAEDAMKFMRANGLEPLVAGSSPAKAPPPQFAAAPSRGNANNTAGVNNTAVANDTGGKGGKSGAGDGAEMEQAALLLAKAKSGDAEAQFLAGGGFYSGENGFKQDWTQAAKWLSASSQQGNADATGTLGQLMIFRTDAPDPKKGVALLEEATKNEDESAFFAGRLSTLLYSGESLGVPRDVKKSLSYARKAADAGNAEGMAQLAVHHYFGIDDETNPEEALRLVRSALKEDPEQALALALLAHLYYDGAVVEQDYAKAHELAVAAAEYDEGLAQSLLGILYIDGAGVEADAATAVGWFERGVENYDPFALYIMGRLYLNGEMGVERDPARAWAYLTLTSERVGFDEMGRDILRQANAALDAKSKKRAAAILEEMRVR